MNGTHNLARQEIVTDSKLDALRKYVQSMDWNIGPSIPMQDGEQFEITHGSQRAIVNYYPKRGKIVVGGPNSPLRDALKTWVTGTVQPTSAPPVQSTAYRAEGSEAKAEQRFLMTGTPIITGSHIGIDESGKGDWFGPLVIAAVFASEDTHQALQAAGVRDSKLLNVPTIQRLASQIEDIVPLDQRYILTLEPGSYNQMYDQYKNINLLLADLYAQVAQEVWKATHASLIVCDQFSKNADRLESSFAAKQLPSPIQRHHAESTSIAVATASILASAAFTAALEQLGRVASMDSPLPRGASDVSRLEAAARQIVKRHGIDALGLYAKLNFKPIQALLG
jgi:ribonuclease HIII